MNSRQLIILRATSIVALLLTMLMVAAPAHATTAKKHHHHHKHHAVKHHHASGPHYPADSTWDRIASCESSGRWAIASGNGYYGGLQFSHSTWIANGGGHYSYNANGTSRHNQIAVANHLWLHAGFSPWGCKP